MSKPTVNVSRYVERNFPSLLPDTKARFAAYIKSLLSSSDVNSLLDRVAAYTNPGLESELLSPSGESSFFFHRELHPLARQYQDLRYQTVLAYSRYFKDLTLFKLIGDWFLSGEAEASYGGVSGEAVSTMDESWDPRFDQLYTMDMYSQGLSVVMFRMFYVQDKRIPGSSYGDLVASIKKARDILLLVAPARVPVVFNTIPSYYVGVVPFKFDSDIASGNLYVEGEGVAANPNRPFFLVPEGEVTDLAYEGSLKFEREGDDLYTTSDSFLVGLTMLSSPFEDDAQLDIIAGLEDADLGRKSDFGEGGGYFYSVVSNVAPLRYSISRAGRELTILLEGPWAVTDVTIFSGHPGLSDIVLQFDPEAMPRYESESLPIFSVRVIVDFGGGHG
jgi:hypothetical protein